MGSLVNFEGLSDVVNNLINKLSDAVGWIATHDTPNRTAINTYIDAIQKSDYDPLTKASMISQAKRTIKEYCNQSNVINIAMLTMSNTAKPENVESDWIAQLMDKVRLVSDEEFQIIWGHILAEECNCPGSIPKVLLHILEQMDKDMAAQFLAVASVSVIYEDEGTLECSPIITGSNLDEYYREAGITFDGLVNLQSIGLIEANFGLVDNSYCVTCNDTPILVRYFDEEYEFPNGIDRFYVGNVIYTKAGVALCRAVQPKKIDGFFNDRCVVKWKEEEKQTE